MEDDFVLKTIQGEKYREVQEGESIIGELPMELKRFSVLLGQKAQEAEDRVRAAIEDLRSRANTLSLEDLEAEHDVIAQMIEAVNRDREKLRNDFWWEVQSEFPRAAEKKLGIRRGGILVEKQEEEEELPQFLVRAVCITQPVSQEDAPPMIFGGDQN